MKADLMAVRAKLESGHDPMEYAADSIESALAQRSMEKVMER